MSYLIFYEPEGIVNRVEGQRRSAFGIFNAELNSFVTRRRRRTRGRRCLGEIDPRNYCSRNGKKVEGGGPNFHATLRDDRVMKIAGSSGDYSNETSNKIPANQPP